VENIKRRYAASEKNKKMFRRILLSDTGIEIQMSKKLL
jgi:hypothetical protein